MAAILLKKRKKKKTYYIQVTKNCSLPLYWLCKQEIAHNKLNSMLEMLESLGVEEVKQFRKRSSTVFRDLLLTIGNQIKIGLLDKIRKSPLLWYIYRRSN